MSFNSPVSGRPHGNRSLVIWYKEFREIFRDKRTIISIILGPLLITPGVMALIGGVLGQQTAKAKAQVYRVGIINPENSPTILKALESEKLLSMTGVIESNAENRIKSRNLDAVLKLPADAEETLKNNHTVLISVLLDAGNETSRSAEARLEGVFDKLGKKTLERRLEANRLPAEFASPFTVSERPIAVGGSVGLLLLSRMLPYVLILSAFSGSIYAAFDQVAGEKERGTLETLLVTPVSRRDIVLGKFGAVVCVCLVSSLISIFGLCIPFVSGLKAYAWISQGGFHLNSLSLIVILLSLFPISTLFAGVLLAISTFVRNQKEAQSYLGWLFPLILVPAMLALVLGADTPLSYALVPVLNTALIIRQAILGSFDMFFILIAFAASILYASLALWFATRLFQKESVLIKA